MGDVVGAGFAGARAGTHGQGCSRLLLQRAASRDPLHKSWAGFRKPRGSTTGMKWGCMIGILIKEKILEICHIRNAITINSDNTTLGK